MSGMAWNLVLLDEDARLRDERQAAEREGAIAEAEARENRAIVQATTTVGPQNKKKKKTTPSSIPEPESDRTYQASTSRIESVHPLATTSDAPAASDEVLPTEQQGLNSSHQDSVALVRLCHQKGQGQRDQWVSQQCRWPSYYSSYKPISSFPTTRLPLRGPALILVRPVLQIPWRMKFFDFSTSSPALLLDDRIR
jgi:hypothetical protein